MNVLKLRYQQKFMSTIYFALWPNIIYKKAWSSEISKIKHFICYIIEHQSEAVFADAVTSIATEHILLRSISKYTKCAWNAAMFVRPLLVVI